MKTQFTPDQRRDIGARIRLARKAMNKGEGLSITEGAERLGVSFSHLSKAECGINGFSSRFVETVAREFGVSLQWLLSGEGQMVTCETREEPERYVVRMVERMDPARIADMVLDARLQEQAEGIAKVLGVDKKAALEIVIAHRLKMRPSES